MEKKKTNKSINTVIWVLLCAMLVTVAAVSVYTVSARRRTKNPVETTAGALPADTTGIPDTTGGITPDTKKKEDTKRPAETARPAETSSPARPAETKKPSVKDSEAKPTDVSSAVDSRYFVAPVDGSVSKSFEIDVPVYSMTMNDYRAHTGVDLSAPLGSDVVSVSSGTVCKICSDPLMGRCIAIDHGDGIYSSYMNLHEEPAAGIGVGTKVALGQVIGAVGESALVEIAEEPHLHLEMKIDGHYVDPLDYFEVRAAEIIGDL